jgi:16S rRNA (guanine966-N2)-methyltransferase
MRKQITKQKHTKSGFIRIISGQYRGRKLPVKNIEGLRPTTDRIKETVFNWLMQDTKDAQVLDCFSGSGGLGFEALSRFANSTTFIELDKQAAGVISDNVKVLHANNAFVINDDALKYLNQPANKCFDLVFVDPPFRKNLANPCCDLLETHNWLSNNALIYVEIEKELHFNAPESWQIIKEKVAGQVLCRLYIRR